MILSIALMRQSEDIGFGGALREAFRPTTCRCLGGSNLRRHKGRFAYWTGRGPRCTVVNDAVHGNEIVLRVPEFNGIRQ